MRFRSGEIYTVVDLLQEYPIQEFDSSITTEIYNARGVIRQYFEDNGIVGKPVKSHYCPFGNDYTGQNANTMGRFVVFIGFTKDFFDEMNIKQIKEYIRGNHTRSILTTEREHFLLYNRTGYEFLIKQNKEKKISKKQEELSNTYYIVDSTKEFKLFKVTATSKRQAILKFFKAHGIAEKPCSYEKLRKDYYGYTQDGLSCRFYVYSAIAPQGGTYYNRDGYAIIYHWWLTDEVREKEEIKEYPFNEALQKIKEEVEERFSKAKAEEISLEEWLAKN